MNRDKHLPEVETETTGEDDEEPSVLLRRKKFRQRAQSSFSSTDSDETFSQNFEGRKFVVRDEQQQEQCKFRQIIHRCLDFVVLLPVL